MALLPLGVHCKGQIDAVAVVPTPQPETIIDPADDAIGNGGDGGQLAQALGPVSHRSLPVFIPGITVGPLCGPPPLLPHLPGPLHRFQSLHLFGLHPTPQEECEQDCDEKQDDQHGQEAEGSDLPSPLGSLQLGDKGQCFRLGHGGPASVPLQLIYHPPFTLIVCPVT